MTEKSNGIKNDIEMKKVRFTQLAKDVLKNRVSPEDSFEIAAYLESVGWNDQRALQEYGAADVFELAHDIWQSIHDRVIVKPFVSAEKRDFILQFKNILKRFLKGIMFALPIAISVIAMVVLKLSLWSYQFLSTEMATSITIGMILSFLTVGGFTQSIARKGFFYITQAYYNMAKKTILYFVRISFILCFVIALFLILFNLIFQVVPIRMVLTVSLFYFLLSSIWLFVTVMYILEKEIIFTALFTLGIIIVAILFYFLNINIIVSQVIALIVIIGIAIYLVIHYFSIAEKKMERGIRPKLPRKSITFYSVMPNFIYGFLFFSFIYIDRVIAWSANDGGSIPYIIWFRGAYELGLDFAILMLIIPMGVIEVIITRLMINVDALQKNCAIDDITSLNKGFIKAYVKNLFLVLVVSSFCAVGVYFFVMHIDYKYSEVINITILSDSTTHYVFIIALISYTVLSVALMNAIILFSLSQPEKVNGAIFKAVIVNMLVGFLLSRWFGWLGSKGTDFLLGISGHAYAVFGLLAGTVVFLLFTAKEVITVFNNIDYYLYGAS